MQNAIIICVVLYCLASTVWAAFGMWVVYKMNFLLDKMQDRMTHLNESIKSAGVNIIGSKQILNHTKVRERKAKIEQLKVMARIEEDFRKTSPMSDHPTERGMRSKP